MKLCDSHIMEKIEENEITIISTSKPAKRHELGKEITGITVDLCLGKEFKPINQAHVGIVDPLKDSQYLYKDVVHCNEYILQPGELVLAITDEHIKLADNITGRLDGKSSLARKGILVHLTASRIDPGWDGQVVLEILNVLPHPVRLTSGMGIAALSFDVLSGDAKYPYRDRTNAQYNDQNTILTPRGPNGKREM